MHFLYVVLSYSTVTDCSVLMCEKGDVSLWVAVGEKFAGCYGWCGCVGVSRSGTIKWSGVYCWTRYLVSCPVYCFSIFLQFRRIQNARLLLVVLHLILAIFVVYGEWVNLANVRALHLVLWASLLYRQRYILFHLLMTNIFIVSHFGKSVC